MSEPYYKNSNNNDDEDFNYDRNYKRRCTGLGAFLSQFSAGELFDPEDKIQKDPLSSENDHQPEEEQPLSNNYYCEVCDVNCNSEKMFDQHINGSKHAKKLNRVNSESSGCGNNQNPYKANGPSSQKKVEKDLRKLIIDAAEPIIGLDYIDELLPETDFSKFEVMYICNLCCVTTTTDAIYHHLIGSRHRSKYLEMKFGIIISKSSKAELRGTAAEIEAQEGGRDISVIKTVMSDSLYPFPPGKKPPAVFQEEEKKKREPPFEHVVAPIVLDYGHGSTQPMSTPTNPSVTSLLNSIANCEVKDQEDAKMAHRVAGSLIRALVKYKAKTVDAKYSSSLYSGCDNLLQSLDTIYAIPSNPRMSSNTPPPPPMISIMSSNNYHKSIPPPPPEINVPSSGSYEDPPPYNEMRIPPPPRINFFK